MPVLLIEKDPFVEAEATTLRNTSAEEFNVRRPFFGLDIKSPRPAFLSVYQDGGQGQLMPVSTKDSSAPGGWSNANHNIILTSVSVSRQEKAQIIETFGDNYAFFYGEKPIVLACSGLLLNTPDFNWYNEWLYNYENFLRGTKCVENRSRVFMGYDESLVQGYMLNFQAQISAEQPSTVPISFQLLLAKPPLDLSSAGADELPEASSTIWVNQAAEARTFYFKNMSGVKIPLYFEVAEYIGALQGLDGSGGNLRYTINKLTGNSEPDLGFSPKVPESIDAGSRAQWVSEPDPSDKQWNTPDEALTALNTKLLAQQAVISNQSARQALIDNPEKFSLGSGNLSVTRVGASLGTGIVNSIVVIPAHLY